jgi:hypothetical protein
MMPIIVEWNSRTYYKPNYYQIWRNGYWYSLKHGWLPAVKGNGRFFSTFKTREAAQGVLDQLIGRA